MKRLAMTILALVCAVTAFSQSPHSVLELTAGPGNSRNSEGDFIRLRNGNILFAYSKFISGTGDDGDPCIIVARESGHLGETWGEDRIIAVNTAEKNGNVMSVSFLRLDKKRIAMFYCRKETDPETGIITRIMMRVSKNEGRTWGQETDCTASLPLSYRVVNNGRIRRISSGRVLIPIAQHTYKGGNFGNEGLLYCLYSDDNCRTWKQSRPLEPRYTDGARVISQEPGVMELKDGRILMYIRADRGRHWYAWSDDRGETWGDECPAPIWSPLSPATMMRLSDGRLMLIWNNHKDIDRKYPGIPDWVRTPLTIAFSCDEAETWTGFTDIDEGYDPEDKTRYWFCYTSFIELEDRILLSYCAGRGLKDSRILSVPKEWLLR